MLQKANGRYNNCGGKETAAECYIKNKEVLKENAKNKYRKLLEKERVLKREYGRNRYMTEMEKKFVCFTSNEWIYKIL